MVRISLGEALLRHPGCALVGERLGWPLAATVGTLAVFWIQSRSAGVVSGQPADIFPLLPVDPRRRDALFRALVEAGFIRRGDDGAFVIAGNAEYAQLIAKRREAGKRGRAQTTLVARERVQARTKAAAPKTKAPLKAKAPKQKASEANAASWEAYATAFASRWGVEPIRNARVNALIAQFVQRVGGVDAPEVLRFYVSHNDSLYLRSSHALTLAVRDAEGLHAQWRLGRQVTTQDIRRLEHSSGIADQLRRIGAGDL